MTKKSTQSLRMGKYCEQAFGLVASYLSAHMSLLPKNELARINKAIIDDLLGDAGPSYRPVPKDARRSALMYCITDIATHLLYLHYHAEMIKRNPHKGKIPDGDIFPDLTKTRAEPGHQRFHLKTSIFYQRIGLFTGSGA